MGAKGPTEGGERLQQVVRPTASAAQRGSVQITKRPAGGEPRGFMM
jgi:hypothetical protein